MASSTRDVPERETKGGPEGVSGGVWDCLGGMHMHSNNQ